MALLGKEIELIPSSKKGKFKASVTGFLYDRDAELADGRLFWKCERRANKECKARIHTKEGVIVRELHQHTHPGHKVKIEVMSALGEVRESARNTQESTQAIINGVTSRKTRVVQAALPTVINMKRTVQRQRNLAQAIPQNPNSLAELEIPNEYKYFLDGDGNHTEFLKKDTGPDDDGERYLMFCIDASLKLLEKCKQLFVDGSFSCAPPLFAQLYTVHGIVHGTVQPLIYFLLPNKRGETYRRIFRTLQRAGVNPECVLLDFEQAAINAVTEVFPQCEVFGCFFHFSQAIWRKIQALGLATAYQTDETFAHKMHMLAALAFVPIDKLDEAFDHLMENEWPDRPECQVLANYFESTYLGPFMRRQNRRRRAVFPPAIWSVYERTRNGIARTNNSAEAWHRGIQSRMQMERPSIWRFINFLKAEQMMHNTTIEQLIAGHEPTKQRRVYRIRDARILRVVNDFDNRTLGDYLRGIAHNIAF